MIVTTMNALISLMTACTGRLPIEADMNRFSPTGGVIRPTQVDEIMMAPKCTSEMPNFNATGAKIGVKIVTIGTESMKQPAISRMITATNRNT